MSDCERELAMLRSFCFSKPTEWEAHKMRWLKDNPEQDPVIVGIDFAPSEDTTTEAVIEQPIQKPVRRKKSPEVTVSV